MPKSLQQQGEHFGYPGRRFVTTLPGQPGACRLPASIVFCQSQPIPDATKALGTEIRPPMRTLIVKHAALGERIRTSSSWQSWLCGLSLAILLAGCAKPVAKVVEVPMPSADELRDRLDQVIDYTYSQRHLDTKDQAAWQIVHGALAFGRDYQIYHDGKLVPAIGYLLGGGELRGWVLRKGDHGLEAVLEAGSKTGQGHEDQWLGYLSQVGLKPDDDIVVGGQTFKIRDMITQAQWDIYDGMEATWTLMAFCTFLPLDTEWKARDGSTWNIPRIVQMETAQDLSTSACGGSHRMFALTIARNRYLAEGGKLNNPDGIWEQADQKIRDAVATAREFQQPDGSLSTNYFIRPSTSADIAQRIGTTGHVLEFMMVAMNDDEIREPWVTRAVVQLVSGFEMTKDFDLECGALYHSVRGLELYRERIYGPRKPQPIAEPTHAATAQADSGATEAPTPTSAAVAQ